MGARVPQIVAFGGGGFSMEAGNRVLDDYVLALTGEPRPRVCFLPTASGDADHYVVRFYIYVGGGSMISMLAVWRAHGIDAILREAWARGVILCGLSAGSLCWFTQGLSAFHGEAAVVAGLGPCRGATPSTTTQSSRAEPTSTRP